MLIDGKQLRDATVTAAKIATAFLNTILRSDGSVSWSAAQNAGSQRLTNLGAPTSPSDAARLQDILAQPWKDRCVAATTGNVNLATVGLAPQDGVTINENDRVLVWKQTAAAENGIYNAHAAGGWVRAWDADSAAELRAAWVRVEKGSTLADHNFYITTDDVVLGTTPITIIDNGLGTPAAFATSSNKAMAASVTTVDFQAACVTAIAATPASDGYVRVSVNGQGVTLGDGVKTKDCYFSADGGTTAKTVANITAGDLLYWVQSVAGYNLAATDVIDFDYAV